MIKKKETKRTQDTANAEDFIKPVFQSFTEDDDAGAVDIFSQGPPAIIDDRPLNIRKEVCSSILDEMDGLKKVVVDTKDKLGNLTKKFFVLKNGDPLAGNYTIRFDKDNDIKSDGEMETILFDKFVKTYSLDIQEIFTKLNSTIELLKYMSRDKRDSYCEVDIFAQEKKEPVQC